MSLKIYFCGSIRGGRGDAELYAKIIDHLKTYGKVLTEHVGRPDVVAEEFAASSMSKETFPKYIHDRDIEWLKSTDVVVAEVTTPSLGVGYELGRAVHLEKPILCLFRPDSGKTLSCMIDGAHDGEQVVVKNYIEPDVFQIIDQYIQEKFKK